MRNMWGPGPGSKLGVEKRGLGRVRYPVKPAVLIIITKGYASVQGVGK